MPKTRKLTQVEPGWIVVKSQGMSVSAVGGFVES